MEADASASGTISGRPRRAAPEATDPTGVVDRPSRVGWRWDGVGMALG